MRSILCAPRRDGFSGCRNPCGILWGGGNAVVRGRLGGTRPPALWVRLCKQTAYCMPRTWFAVGVSFTLHTNRHPPFRLAESRLRRLLAGRPLRWVSQFSITSIPTKMLALRPLYANGEKYYAVRRNLSKNDNAICGILLYNKAISENLVV